MTQRFRVAVTAGSEVPMSFSRRRFLTGAAVTAAFASARLSAQPKRPSMNIPLFHLAVINDEISPDFEHACHVAAVDFGLSYIELRDLWGKNVVNLSDQEIETARQILRKYKLRVTDIASPLFKTDFPHAEVSTAAPKQDAFGASFTYQQQPEVLERVIYLARSFETEHIRCFDFTRLEDQGTYRSAIDEDLRRAAETCARHNLILMLENEQSCNTATGAEAAKTLAAVPHPNFMLNWDPANAQASGEIAYPNGYDLLPKERIGHCHSKDVIRQPNGSFQWECVGKGSVDWTGQLRALVRQKFSDTISLETHWRGAGSAEASTRASMAALKTVLHEVEVEPIGSGSPATSATLSASSKGIVA